MPLSPQVFYVFEPKKRLIVAANLRDRVVHHAYCNVVEPIFDKRLIYDTYACRVKKGTLAAVYRFDRFMKSLLRGYSEREIYVLKADIYKYFESIDHSLLLKMIEKRIKDERIIWLTDRILEFGNYTLKDGKNPVICQDFLLGIPIGNLTSQFFANLYLGELDIFVKHTLRAKYYIRYMDDFIILDSPKERLKYMKEEIRSFLNNRLGLKLHPQKQTITPLKCGIDFLGYRIFSTHKRLRKENVKRFKKRLKLMRYKYQRRKLSLNQITASIRGWMGYSKHADSFNLRKKLLGDFVL